MKSTQEYSGLEIAITGMACRFPGAADIRQFWSNLRDGVESIHFFSDDELNAMGAGGDARPGFVAAASLLQHKDRFDYSFFDYTPDEAQLLNPEHRIFHECVWEALEDAGYDPALAGGPVALYAGAGEDLNWKVYSVLMNSRMDMPEFTLVKINDKDFLASLLSYKLDLHGPSLAVQTACSTSLVAVHLACRSLLLGETRMALAGGVSLFTVQQRGYQYDEGMIKSKDGHCRAFDAEASGTNNGEGAGVVVLKRLKDAIADGDHIHAVIKGSAINNDGRRKVGYTAPSVEGQAECIRMAQKFARVDPATISYVEAHGTGTRLGDPIEVEALNLAFNNKAGSTCALGSVKTNFGHLNTAAGIAGLIKTALSLQHRQLPPSLHFREPNPEMSLEAGPFYINTALIPWGGDDALMRAGVSSFGIGGTNAHVILEAAPAPAPAPDGRTWQVLTLSARTASSVNRYLDKLQVFLGAQPAGSAADLAYTLQTGRRHFDCRKTFVFRDHAELLQLLASGKAAAQPAWTGPVKTGVAFMFTGAGSQYPGMGSDLYHAEPAFRTELDKGFDLLLQLTGTAYRDILFPAQPDDLRINRMLHTQPCIFIFEYALARLLQAYGVQPACMIGHSIGEYVAACIAGVFSYEDALKLVVLRGELMNRMGAGAMVSVAISEEQAHAYTNDHISLAAVNSTDQVVFSGDVASIDALIVTLDALDFQCVRLHASHAGHSPMIDAVADEYRAALQAVPMQAPALPFVSNLTGQFITAQEATSPDYWARHMRHTVRFYKGIGSLMEACPDCLLVECGGGHSLTSLLRQYPAALGTPVAVNLIRPVKEAENDERYFAAALGRIWSYGVAVNWRAYHRDSARKRVSLPTYAFEPDVFPVEVDPMAVLQGATTAPVSGDLTDWLYFPAWKQSAAHAKITPVPGRICLYFAPAGDRHAPIVNRLLEAGVTVVTVRTGDGFERLTEFDYLLNPLQRDDFRHLLDALSGDGVSLTDIIYAWGCDAGSGSPALNAADPALHLAYFDLAWLTGDLMDRNRLDGIRVMLLTEQLYRVTGNETTNSTQALAAGLLNALPQEYPVACFHVDLGDDPADERTLQELTREFFTDRHGLADRVVALRHGQRWLMSHERNALPVSGRDRWLRQEGVYLITGGLGRVGMTIARYLAMQYNATVILTGRRSPEADPAIQQQLDRLLPAGGTIRYRVADVSDAAAFTAMVTDVEDAHGAIHGVIHTAGNIDFNDFELVKDTSYEKTFAVMAPKLGGIHTLIDVFADRRPDFVWITSSLASVLAGVSFGAYSAANLYMDQLVTGRRLPGWSCVCFSELAFDESAVMREQQQGRSALLPDEIPQLLEWSMQLDNPVVLETAADLGNRFQQVYNRNVEAILADDALPSSGKKARPHLSTAYVPAETETESRLLALVEDFFGIEAIGTDDNFFELGGDSLKAMVLLKRIKKEFDLTISLKAFFGMTSFGMLAAELENIQWLRSDVRLSNEITL